MDDRTGTTGLLPETPAQRKRRIRDALDTAVKAYPSMDYAPARRVQRDLFDVMKEDLDRIAFHLDVILQSIPRGGSVADVGGGITAHCHALALMGYRGVLVDDFGDHWHGSATQVLERQKRDGVEIISCDVLQGLPLEPNSFDAIMSFDILEHLHHSPKKMLLDCAAALKPGGLFFLGVPNCVNLRKRITVPFGIGKWSYISEWYEEEVFRGHVREPDVDDLLYIAKSMDLQDVRILGRNWLGYTSYFPLVRALTPIADRILQLRPSLCANIYLLGRKKAAA